MHKSIQNLIEIKKNIKNKLLSKNIEDNIPEVIAVSKTFKIDHILPLVDFGHLHYGENKVQEAQEKWSEVKKKNKNIKLHLVGKLQTNKVSNALKIFDYIHSLDNQKLAEKISKLQNEYNLKPKIFIQVNIGNELQKGGIRVDEIEDFLFNCNKLNLNIIGLMCIPPINSDPEKFFLRMKFLKQKFKLADLSMGMSSDYLIASELGSTYIRIGTNIFGQRNIKF